MSITVIVAALVLLVIAVVAFGLRRDRVAHPAGAQTIAILLIVVVGVLILTYMVLRHAR